MAETFSTIFTTIVVFQSGLLVYIDEPFDTHVVLSGLAQLPRVSQCKRLLVTVHFRKKRVVPGELFPQTIITIW